MDLQKEAMKLLQCSTENYNNDEQFEKHVSRVSEERKECVVEALHEERMIEIMRNMFLRQEKPKNCKNNI